MDRSEILDKIEEIQDDVDAKGFMGSNENDLWRREAIADFIIKNFVICSSSLTLPTSTEILSDCKNSFKDLQGKGNLDYRSYQNGYLHSFSKYVIEPSENG